MGVRSDIGCLPGELSLHERLNGEQMLTYVANLRKMNDLGDAPQVPSGSSSISVVKSVISRAATSRRSGW